MGTLVLVSSLDLMGNLPALVAANAAGDLVPNPSGRTQLWIQNLGTPAKNLINQSIDVSAVDTVAKTAEYDAQAGTPFSGVNSGEWFNFLSFTNPGNNNWVRVEDPISDTKAVMKRFDGLDFVAETGETDIAMVNGLVLTIKSQRNSRFGPYKDLEIPIPFGTLYFTVAFDGRRFNNSVNQLEISYDTVTNVSLAAVEYGTYYEDKVA